MADATETLAAELAALYAGARGAATRPLWNAADILAAGTPAATFVAMHPEHGYSRFLSRFVERYTAEARLIRVPPNSGRTADLPFVGARVLAGEAPVLVISQDSYSTKAGSISLWAMLFPFGPRAPSEYCTTRSWRRWAGNYSKYCEALCGARSPVSFGFDPELLIVTDASLPPETGDEHRFFQTFVAAIPRPRLIVSLGELAAARVGASRTWRRARDLQKRAVGVPEAAVTGVSASGVPVVVSPFAFGNNSKDMGKSHFLAAVAAARPFARASTSAPRREAS